MKSVLPDAVRDVVAAAGPEPSPTQREMEAYAEETDFPVVGPEVGGMLAVLARAVGAERVFEFGSGFGYSATWFAGAVPDDGQVVLTEVDADELEMAREYLAEAGLAGRVEFEHGDALASFERYDGPFDVVLLDHQKSAYSDAIEPVRSKLAPGGLVLADNALQGPFTVDELAAGFEGEPVGEYADRIEGVVDYLERMRDDPEFETVVLPLGEGLAVSHYAGGD